VTGIGAWFRFARKWLFGGGYTMRRAMVALGFVLVLPLLEIIVWSSLLIDRILFSRYRDQTVDAPVFVVGNFRSGTTRLHRLLATDDRQFTTMSLGEILFAPSILLRKFVAACAYVDRAIGRPVARLNAWIESRWHDINVMHEVSLGQPEEDEYLCLHIWASLSIGLSSGLLEEARPFARFDHDIEATDRRRIIDFYHRCIQRHLHFHNGRRGDRLTYLAKNPAMSPKVDSVLEQYPDARFVYIARNPLEAVPSFVSMMNFSWDAVGVQGDREDLKNFILDLAGHWYRYPLERLSGLPDAQYLVVTYDELVASPGATLRRIYAHFDLEIPPDFEAQLENAEGQAQTYEARHEYNLESLGLNRSQIVADFADVFERFGFSVE
jgi:hypothetical protein